MLKNLPANAGDAGVERSIPGSGRSPRGGNGNTLQYSCLENPMDRGAWQAHSPRVRKESGKTEHAHPYESEPIVGIILDIYNSNRVTIRVKFFAYLANNSHKCHTRALIQNTPVSFHKNSGILSNLL